MNHTPITYKNSSIHDIMQNKFVVFACCRNQDPNINQKGLKKSSHAKPRICILISKCIYKLFILCILISGYQYLISRYQNANSYNIIRCSKW